MDPRKLIIPTVRGHRYVLSFILILIGPITEGSLLIPVRGYYAELVLDGRPLCTVSISVLLCLPVLLISALTTRP